MRVDRATERFQARRLAMRRGVTVGPGAAIGPRVRVNVAEGGVLEIGAHAYVDAGTTLNVGPTGRLTIADTVSSVITARSRPRSRC